MGGVGSGSSHNGAAGATTTTTTTSSTTSSSSSSLVPGTRGELQRQLERLEAEQQKQRENDARDERVFPQEQADAKRGRKEKGNNSVDRKAQENGERAQAMAAARARGLGVPRPVIPSKGKGKGKGAAKGRQKARGKAKGSKKEEGNRTRTVNNYARPHVHRFGPAEEDEERGEDCFRKTCLDCGFVERYEAM